MSEKEPIQQSVVIKVMPQIQIQSPTENNGVKRWDSELR